MTALIKLVERFRDAEKHWRKRADETDPEYEDGPKYEDGLADGFASCADSLENEISKSKDKIERPMV